MKKNYKIIITTGAGILIIFALFLFFKSEKKVQFSKNQEEQVAENNNPREDGEDISQEPSLPENESSSETAGDNFKAENSSPSNDQPDLQDDHKKSENAKAPKIINRLVSWGYEKSSSRKIDTIIIHSTYNAVGSDEFDLDDIINKEYKPYGVSPQYIIDRKGNIYRLVADGNIAYHAGESRMPDGRTNVNSFSLGIELVNAKDTKPTGDQYDALKNLVRYLKGTYPVKYVLGHKDIAPGRKDDPWNFSWSMLK